MKKLSYILLVLLSVLLVGCGKTTVTNNSVDIPTKIDLEVASPSGAPAIVFYNHLNEEKVEINSQANNVIAYLTSNSSKDIVVAPTNAGIQAITKKNAPFKIAAVITFGNFFIITTGRDQDNEMNEGDKVLAFQENGVAGLIYKYLYGDKGLDTTYLADVQAVRTEVLTNENLDYDYIFLAQPVVSAVLSQKKGFGIYTNSQMDYQNKTNGLSITQAAIFVSNNADQAKVDLFLKMIKKEIEELKENPDTLSLKTIDVSDEAFASKLAGTKTLITTLIENGNQIGIGFEYAYNYKESIDSFITTLGLESTNEEIYWRPQN